MWCGKSVTLILPTYNEKEASLLSVEEFYATGIPDEIIVINNNAADVTSE